MTTDRKSELRALKDRVIEILQNNPMYWDPDDRFLYNLEQIVGHQFDKQILAKPEKAVKVADIPVDDSNDDGDDADE